MHRWLLSLLGNAKTFGNGNPFVAASHFVANISIEFLPTGAALLSFLFPVFIIKRFVENKLKKN